MKIKILGLLLVVILVFTACSAKEENVVEEDNIADKTTVDETTVDEKEETEDEETKSMAPDFTLLSSNGEEISLSDYRGKVVFLNFFTTWCTYCEAELPDFQKAYEKYGDDIEILLVDVTTQERISEKEIIEWFEEFDLTMPMVLDPEGILMKDYPIRAFPTTFFIGREGELLAYYEGALSEELIDRAVEDFAYNKE